MIEPACRAGGGRREANRQDRHAAIVALAMRSFLEKGYGGTTMSGIAAALGGSKATLWRYFPSKEALLGAVIDYGSAEFRRQISAILDPGEGDLATTLRRFYRSLLDKVTSPETIALNRLVVAEAGRFPELGRTFFEHAPRLTHRQLAAYLEGAIERGQFARTDPLAAARLLVAALLSGCHQQLLLGLIERAGGAAIDADVDRTLALTLAAYPAPPR